MLLCTNRSLVRPYIDLNLARRGSTCSGVYVASGLRREMCAPMSSNRLVAINLELANSQPTRQHLVQQSGTRVTIVMTLNSTMLAICYIEEHSAKVTARYQCRPLQRIAESLTPMSPAPTILSPVSDCCFVENDKTIPRGGHKFDMLPAAAAAGDGQPLAQMYSV